MRSDRYTWPRNSGPSYHQWPNSSVSNGATTTPRRWAGLVVAIVASRLAKCAACADAIALAVSGIVRLLQPEVDVVARHSPELESPGPPDLVKLEVPTVAGIPLVATPYLRGRLRVANERRHGFGRVRRVHPVCAVRRARRFPARIGGGDVLELIGDDLAVETERAPRARHVCVDEEEAEPGVGEIFLDAGARPGVRRVRQRLPWPVGAIRAFRHPAPPGRPAEQPPVLALADVELESNTLVAPEERQEPVRRGRGDELDAPAVLEIAEDAHDVAVDRPEQRTQAGEALSPVVDQRNRDARPRLPGGTPVPHRNALGAARSTARAHPETCR